MAPVIDAMASQYAGKARVGMRYSIRGLPTLLVFKGGNVVEQRMGVIGKAELQKMLDPHL